MKQIKKFLSIFISLSLLLSIHNLAYAKKISPQKPDAPQAVSSQKDTPKETPPEEKSISPSKDNNSNITLTPNKDSFFKDINNFYRYFKFYFLGTIMIQGLERAYPNVGPFAKNVWDIGNAIAVFSLL